MPDGCCPEGMCPEVGGTVMEEGPLSLTLNVLDKELSCFLFVLVCAHMIICVCWGGGSGVTACKHGGKRQLNGSLFSPSTM